MPLSRRVAAPALVGLALAFAAGCTSTAPTAPSSTRAVPGAAAPTPTATPTATPALRVTPLPIVLPTTVSRLVALPAGDRILLLGGLDSGTTTTAAILSVSPSTGTVTTVGHLAQATHDAGGAVLGGRAVVIGGGISASTPAVQAVALTGGTASISGHLPQARSDDAVASDATTAYVVGGYTGSTALPEILGKA